MVPTNTNSNSHQFWQWNSPLPYLFGSLGIMVSLITIALIILACSYHERSNNSSGDDAEEKPEKPESAAVNIPMPQIVVIMAGDENPTHLAVPMASFPNYPDHV